MSAERILGVTMRRCLVRALLLLIVVAVVFTVDVSATSLAATTYNYDRTIANARSAKPTGMAGASGRALQRSLLPTEGLATAPRFAGFLAAEARVTGARGPVSGRQFDPEAAGGPVERLNARSAPIGHEGVNAVEAHLSRFAGGGPIAEPEASMLGRLRSIASGDLTATEFDQNFYTHELREADRYAALGFGPESGADLGPSEMYDVWNNVHTATLEDYGITGAELFHPEVMP